MLIRQINRTDPEQVFGSYTNVEGSTMPIDAVAQLDNATTTDGNRIVQCNTGGLDMVVGIVDAAIADAAVGLVQMYGYRATSIVLRTDTSMQTGIKLVPVVGQDYLSSLAGGDGRDGLFALLESLVSSTATVTDTLRIFIRCM